MNNSLVTIKNYQDFAKEFTISTGVSKGQLKILKVGATWCGPCKTIRGPYVQLANHFRTQIKFFEVDYDIDQDIQTVLVEHFDIQALPTFLFFGRNGYFKKMEGINQQELQQEIVNLLNAN